MQQILLLLLIVYSYADSEEPSNLEAVKKARENLIDEILKDPTRSIDALSSFMEEFIKQFKLNEATDYYYDKFHEDLCKIETNLRRSDSDIIYPYYSNYILYKNRKSAWEVLRENIRKNKEYNEGEISNFLTKFFINDMKLNERQLKELITKRMPTISETDIPSELHERYLKYSKNKEMTTSKNRVASVLNNYQESSINKFQDIIEEFNKIFKIKKTDMTKEKLREILVSKLTTSDDLLTSYEKFWIFYKKYLDYINCLEKRNSLTRIYELNDKTPYYMVWDPWGQFKTACKIKDSYENVNSFWEEWINTDPTVEKSLAKVLFDYYNYYIYMKNKENAKNQLEEQIESQKTNPDLNIEPEMKEFIKAFDLSVEEMKIEDMNYELSQIKKYSIEEVDGTKILQKYNEYVSLQDLKKKIESLVEKINKDSDIKSYQLKNEMEDFIKASKIEKDQTFNEPEDFLKYIQKIYPKFDQDSVIYPEYKKYLEYQQREENRQEILRLIRTENSFLIRNHVKLFKNFIKSHFKDSESYPDYDGFKKELENMDGVDEEDIYLLHPFYANYLTYEEKEVARKNLLENHREDPTVYIYDLKDLTKNFINSHYLNFAQTLDVKEFGEYLDHQDLEIDNDDKIILFERYKQYLKYTKMVENREKIIRMIEDKNKLSEMKDLLKQAMLDYGIGKKEAYNKILFQRFIRTLDPDFDENYIERFNSIAISYYELIERIPIKESLLEFVYLNPEPKTVDLEAYMRPFLLHYNLNYHGFAKSTDFLDHIREQEDDIPKEESDILFKYYHIFTKIDNRWNSKNTLFEFLQKETSPPIPQLFPIVELFVSAYELTHYQFSNIDEFRSMALSKDDTFEEKFVKSLYDPVVKYLQFSDRVQKRKKLFDFITLRTEATVQQLDYYINQVIESYNIDNDILTDKTAFIEHVFKLDYSMTDDNINELYKILFDHSLTIDRIRVKESVLDIINVCTADRNHRSSSFMLFFVDSYQLAGKHINDVKSFYDILLQKDITITLEEAKKIHPYYIKYVENANRQIIRTSILGFLEENPNPTFEELSKFIKPYIKSHDILSHELYKYERFFLKNQAMDDGILNHEIDNLWKAVQKYIKSEIFKKEHISILLHNDIIYDENFKKPTGIKGAFYNLFRYFGAFPHYLPKGISFAHLTHNQKSFESSYEYLTGIKFFHARPDQPSQATNSNHA